MANEKKSFLKNTYILIIKKIIDTVLFFLNSLLIARCLGVEGKGQYTIFLLVSSMVYTFSNIGIVPATVFFINKEKKYQQEIVIDNLLISILIIIVGLILGTLMIIFGSNQLFGGMSKNYLFIALLAFPGYFLNINFLGIIEAFREFKMYSYFSLLQKIFNIFLLLIAFIFFKYNSIIALIIYIFTQYLVALLMFIYLKQKKYLSLIFKRKKSYRKEIITYGFKSYLSNIIAYFNYRADLIIIAYYLNNYFVGLYSVVVTLAEQIWTFSASISTVLFPQLSGLENNKDKSELVFFVNRIVFMFSIVMSCLFFVFSNILIKFIYGNEYLQAVNAFKLLLPGIAIGGMTKILANYISSNGKPEVNSLFSFICVIFNIILNIILIPSYGINGAAFATTISYVIGGFLKVIYVKKTAKVSFFEILIVNISDIKYLCSLFFNKIKYSKKEYKNSTKKTIVILSHVVFDSSDYCSFVHSHAKALSQKGFEIYVIALLPWFPFLSLIKKKRKYYYDNYKGIIVKDNINIIYKKYLSFSNFSLNSKLNLNGISYFLTANHLLKKNLRHKFENIRMIDAHMFKIEGYAAYLLKKKYKFTTFITLHGTSFEKNVKTNLGKKQIKKISKTIDYYVCVSEKIERQLEQLNIKNRILIYNGIDFHKVQRNNENKNIIFVGALNEVKNPFILLEAFNKIHQEFIDSKLIIIGDGPLDEKLKNYVKCNLITKDVIFTGRIHSEKVYEYLSNSSIFVLPSSPEGFGISYVEAMYCGCIAVGIKGEGIDGFLKNKINGFLIKNNSNSIYFIIKYIFNNDVSSIRQTGINSAITMSWDENAQKYIEKAKL